MVVWFGWMSKRNLNFIDLFAGAGGLSEGFIKSGFFPIAHVEMNHDAVETLKTREVFHFCERNNLLEKYNQYLLGNISKEEIRSFVPDICLERVIEKEMNEDVKENNIKSKENSEKSSDIDNNYDNKDSNKENEENNITLNNNSNNDSEQNNNGNLVSLEEKKKIEVINNFDSFINNEQNKEQIQIEKNHETFINQNQLPEIRTMINPQSLNKSHSNFFPSDDIQVGEK